MDNVFKQRSWHQKMPHESMFLKPHLWNYRWYVE